MGLSDVIHVIAQAGCRPASRAATMTAAELGLWMAGQGFGDARMRLEPIANPSAARLAGPARSRRWRRRWRSAIAAGRARRGGPLRGARADRHGRAGSRLALLETLNRATPLIFTGLAVAVAFRAKLWNIGAEAQLYAGRDRRRGAGDRARSGQPARSCPSRRWPRCWPGRCCLLGPALLKTRLGVDEVVTTLLLNFIMLLFVSYLLEGPMKDPMGDGLAASPRPVPEARLPRIVEGLRLHWGFALALIAAVVVWVIQTRTTLGFEMRAVGAEPARPRALPACRSTRCC